MANLTRATWNTYTRRYWSDAWVEIPFFDPLTVAYRVSPSMSSADLEYKFGRVMRRGELEPSLVEPLDAPAPFGVQLGDFVKIVISEGGSESPTQFLWYGVLVEQEKTLGGISEGVRYGVQHWRAFGMEYLLSRVMVDKTYLRDFSSFYDNVIERAVGFNLGAGGEQAHELAGNRLSGTNDPERFDNDLDGTKWTLYEIAKYLVENFHPTDLSGSAAVPFKVTTGVTAVQNMGLYSKPTLPAEGRTVKELLDQIADRRRMLAWTCLADDSEVTVRFFNMLDQSVTLPGDQGVLSSSESQSTWDFDSDNAFVDCRLLESEIPLAHEVIVRGERMTSTFTMSSSETLIAGWDAADLAQYNIGATLEAGYAALGWQEKQAANQRARESHRLRKVFRYFVLPANWNAVTVAGEEFAPHPVTNLPVVHTVAGLRALDRLPLRIDLDYTTLDDAKRTQHEQSKSDYRAPLAVIAASGGYQYLDRPKSGSVAVRPDAGGRNWGGHVRMLDEAPGFEVQIPGEPAHVIAASAEFTPQDDPDLGDVQPDLSWQNIQCTVCMEVDAYCEARWPYPPVAGGENVAKRLYIYVPNARLDYLVKNTILSLDASGAAITAGGGWIRDDRPRLKALARIAYAWYGTPRKALAATVHRIPAGNVFGITLGSIITSIGTAPNEIPIGTMITEYVLDLVRGTTSIKTDFAELDVAKL